ncbi:aminotransferase class I/II-fold pyridoxal phosphate-dependent enzyme [uncultured Anaerococcus sp.]|uniref:aminotransferase class I/II-fold pyridoxal phosphate-dependent enzyme n=1 Tax=uncultured Anaerococcus sp. TaxID=293428 RepID=UPI00260346AF|nr:aminotransferase class I/II-fold pyridoxal phosphate-dependent enzyme [uncultured Anaerococcus sp.]
MLNEKLDKYLDENYYPFHMPGSKRSLNLRNDLPYRRDLTEIDDFDNLNDPKEIFKDLEDRLAEIYKVNQAVISTNGSTCGILSSIRALTYKNKNILIQRTCHKAVYNSIEIFDLDVDYVDVKLNDINAVVDISYKDLEKKFDDKSYAAFVLTSPSYEGYTLDLNRIYKICKKNNVPLLLDLAHGSHFILDKSYNRSFDIAITSFHKNLSGLTPAAAILINNEDFNKNIRHNMAIFQSSSPSYVIVESIDEIVENFDSFGFLYDELNKYLDELYSLQLENLKLVDSNYKDRTKILISTRDANISGRELQNMLKKEKIEIEMAYPNYCLLISTIFDREIGFNRLKKALVKIDARLSKKSNDFKFSYKIPKQAIKIGQALLKEKHSVKIEDSLYKISASFVYAYPPGIPILTPGELIDEEIIENINYLLKNNIHLNIDRQIDVLIDK